MLDGTAANIYIVRTLTIILAAHEAQKLPLHSTIQRPCATHNQARASRYSTLLVEICIHEQLQINFTPPVDSLAKCKRDSLYSQTAPPPNEQIESHNGDLLIPILRRRGLHKRRRHHVISIWVIRNLVSLECFQMNGKIEILGNFAFCQNATMA